MHTISRDAMYDSLYGATVLTVPRVFTFVNMLSTFMNMRRRPSAMKFKTVWRTFFMLASPRI